MQRWRLLVNLMAMKVSQLADLHFNLWEAGDEKDSVEINGAGVSRRC